MENGNRKEEREDAGDDMERIPRVNQGHTRSTWRMVIEERRGKVQGIWKGSQETTKERHVAHGGW